MRIRVPFRNGNSGASFPVDFAGRNSPDIPVLIDDVKTLDAFAMSRCTYFSIDAEAAVDDWVTLLRSRGIPFLIMGVSTVIHRPEVDVLSFGTPDQIDSLFNRIEQTDDLIVETGHIWLPNEMFDDYRKRGKHRTNTTGSMARGAVWRISFDLFRQALRFERDLISSDQFILAGRSLLRENQLALSYSAEETQVFASWSAAQIEAARSHYYAQRADRDRGVLQWQDQSGAVHEG